MAKVLCMEVGTSTVRLAEVVKSGKSLKITKTYAFDTPDDASKDGKIRVTDSVVAAIKTGLIESEIKATDVYFVVDSTKILFKQVELPFMQNKLIPSTLDLAFSDIFPVDEALYHLSYVRKKIYEKNGQKMMSLDVFAIPNDLSESYYNLSVALGLNAKGLSDSSHSMISMFPNTFKGRNVAMVNIGESVSTLTIAVDGEMVFNKTIPYGVESTVGHVIHSPLTMDNLGVVGASEFLYSQNILLRQMPRTPIDDSPEAKLQYTATASLTPLIKAIESTFSSFLSKENIRIQEFQLSGLGAGFAGITQLLASEFGISVTVVQQEGHLQVAKTAADDTLLLSCYPAVGSILNKINFFTTAEQAGGEVEHNKKIDRLAVLGSIVICLAAFGYGAYSLLQAGTALQDAKDDYKILNTRVQELRSLGIEIAFNEYNTALSYNEKVKQLYDKTSNGNEDMTVFLTELENKLPTSSRVTSISMSPKSARVSIKCKDKFVAAGVLHLLRNMKTAHDMQCSSISAPDKDGWVSFQCSFSLVTTSGQSNNTQGGK